MAALLSIYLNQVRFFAYHGLFEEEQKTGNEFEVNLAVSYDPGSELIDELSETVNYASLFSILQEEMQKPRELLETFVMEVAELLHKTYPSIKKIEISLSKLNPPIAKFTGRVGVKYSKEF
ncbi:MAG: dihydroneopterin aldolase [Chitinophagaceae bacterium]